MRAFPGGIARNRSFDRDADPQGKTVVAYCLLVLSIASPLREADREFGLARLAGRHDARFRTAVTAS